MVVFFNLLQIFSEYRKRDHLVRQMPCGHPFNRRFRILSIPTGSAGPGTQEIYRSDWNAVKDVIDGKKPLSSLSSDCPG